MKKQKKATLVFITTIICLYFIQVVDAKRRTYQTIPILGYHHIVPDKDKEAYFKNNMWVSSLSSFEQQMKFLFEEGYHSVTLEDIYAWHQGKKTLPKKSVVITFDDGFYSNTAFACPVLESYGFQGSVFVIGSLIEKQRTPYNPSIRQHASLEDMRDQRVLTYYSHSYDLHHKKGGEFKINTLTKQQLRNDTKKIAALVSIDFYAYPYGRYNSTIKEVLKQEAVKLAFGYNENRKATLQDDAYSLPRFNINAYTKLDVFKTMLESR